MGERKTRDGLRVEVRGLDAEIAALEAQLAAKKAARQAKVAHVPEPGGAPSLLRRHSNRKYAEPTGCARLLLSPGDSLSRGKEYPLPRPGSRPLALCSLSVMMPFQSQARGANRVDVGAGDRPREG